jgi:DNA-binding MarR family transcriptional regulator
MKTKALLIQLVDYLAAFEEENQHADSLDMGDFIGYLHARYPLTGDQMRQIGGTEAAWIKQSYGAPQTDIATLITLMYRYAKGYIKKALKDSLIQSPEEFSYLIVLMTFDSLTKTELIVKNVMEKTSGAEVIRRLVNLGLIRQFADEADKRTMRVAVTDLGKTELTRIMPKMQQVSNLVVGDLTDTEIMSLSYMLRKLDYFHNDIYINKKDVGSL